METYYKNQDVLDRIKEFLGGGSLEEATCVYLSRCDKLMYKRFEAKKPGDLQFYLDRELDIGRSLWDRDFLLVHYMNGIMAGVPCGMNMMRKAGLIFIRGFLPACLSWEGMS